MKWAFGVDFSLCSIKVITRIQVKSGSRIIFSMIFGDQPLKFCFPVVSSVASTKRGCSIGVSVMEWESKALGGK